MQGEFFFFFFFTIYSVSKQLFAVFCLALSIVAIF
jgi:hypothetical protein